MTLSIKQKEINGYYIGLEIEKGGLYHVFICKEITPNYCGYPLKEMTYSNTEKQKAINTFNRYAREISKV